MLNQPVMTMTESIAIALRPATLSDADLLRHWDEQPQVVAADPNDDPFQQLLFAKIVPNCKRLGLLDANNGWLRQRFEEMRVIQFEDAMDTEAEYELLDAVARDRAAAPAER